MRFFICNWVNSSLGECSYFWSKYGVPSAQIRINKGHCIMAVKDLFVDQAMEADPLLAEVSIGQKKISKTIADTMQSKLGIDSAKSNGMDTVPCLEKILKNKNVGFDWTLLESIVNAEKSLHVDVSNADMEL